VICASVIYGKGILHSGTHIIDLLRYLFGEVKEYKALHSIKDCIGFDDVTIGGFLRLKRCDQCYVMAGDDREYSFFQLDIVCEKSRLYFSDLGFLFTEQQVINDPVYKGYKILGKSKTRKTNFDKAMINMVSNAVGHISVGEPLVCDAEDAMETQKICLNFKKQICRN